MAIFVTPRAEVAQAVAAIWGLQLGNTTMTDVLTLVDKSSVASVVNAAFDASYGSASDEAVAAAFVSNLGITGTMAAGAADYVESVLTGAANRAEVLMNVAKAFSALTTTDATVAGFVADFNAKVAAAVVYSGTAGTTDVAIDGLPSETSFELSTGRDVLAGTSGADTFVADVFDNQNTWQSGDSIDGKGGVDVLEATLGLSSAFAILPRSENLEIVYIRSQANNSDGNGGDNNPAGDPVADGSSDDNTVDAELMRGVQEWWNTDSRADLVIEDIRILDNEITKDVAIGWANADPSSIESKSGVDKVDYEVYFSPESLRKDADTTSNAIQLTVGNQVETKDFDPDAPLQNIPYTAVQFLVDGQSVVLELDLVGIETYDDLWDKFSEAFEAAKATSALLADVSINRIEDGDSFFSRDGVLRKADVIQLTNADGTITPAATLGWLADGGLPPNNAFSANVEQGAAVTTSDLITSTIYLDNVGRESEAGDLMIGSMSTRTGVERFDITVLNNDNTSGTYTSSGSWIGSASSTNNFLREVIAENDSVGSSDPDYLYIGTGMDDENNNLTTIRQTFLSTQSTEAGFVKYQAAVDAALLNADGLTDVRLFDASAMTGKVKVGATITSDSIQKYQDLVDTQADDGFEDVDFQYETGSNNDSVNLVLDSRLWGEDSSSEVVSGRHDFSFSVDGNAGNDHLQVQVASMNADGVLFGGFEDWYTNQMINFNISVEGGTGDDTIRTPGAGDKKISGGTGADTIYSDNTGDIDEYGGDVDGNPYDADGGRFNDGRATWVFNAQDNDVYDLESELAASVSAVNAKLTVDFRGFTKTVFIANSENALTNVRITDLSVNQAIKDAINNDAVLSKLLVAEDGPGRTLIVRSLIDGEPAEQDLSVSFSNKALTTTQAAVTTITLFNPTSAATSMTTLLDGYKVSDFAWDGSTLTGDQSDTSTDNVIEGGTGNDVIVLSTTDYLAGNNTSDDEYVFTSDAEFTPSKNLLGSNETVKYTGFGNGTDSIVNFDTTYDAQVLTYVSDAGEATEVVTLTFTDSDGTPAAQTIIFDGQTITLSAPATQGVIPSEDVAYQFATQLDSTNWEVLDHTYGTSTVQIIHKTIGDVTDLVAGDFTGTYVAATGGNGTITPAVDTQGADGTVFGTASTFVVTFDVAATAAAAAGAFSFDGATVNYAQGDGAITLAAAVVAGTYTNWAVTDSGANWVEFTALATGATALGTAAEFDMTSGSLIVGSISGTLGTADVDGFYEVAVAAGPGNGFDFLDFTAYDVAGVVVNGVVLRDIAGDGITVTSAAPNNTTYNYIKMTESATNQGEYKIELVTVDDDTPATADTVQLIGVADFGDTAEPVFVAENFII